MVKFYFRFSIILLMSLSASAQTIDATIFETNLIGSGSPKNLITVGDNLFFCANNEINGNEMWVYNSSMSVPKLLKDIYPGINSGIHPIGNGTIPHRSYVAVGNILYFSAYSTEMGSQELWRTDGTDLGTFKIKTFNYSTDLPIQSFVHLNGKLIFAVAGDEYGEELWSSDGTEEGTVRIKDIYPGTEGSGATMLTLVNGVCFFIANDSANGFELWKTDGTESGTEILKNIDGTTSSSVSTIKPFLIFNNQIFFYAKTSANGDELWKSDGTSAGTQMVKDIVPGSGSSSTVGLLGCAADSYFVFNVKIGSSYQLWKSDGTNEGTMLLKNLYTNVSSFSDTDKFAYYNNKIYFNAAPAGTSNFELWCTDGTVLGTQLFKELYPGTTGSSVENIHVFDNFFMFKTNYPSDKFWKSNGTADGTVEIENLQIENEIPIVQYAQLGDNIFFCGKSTLNGNELWKLDSETGNATLFYDLNHKLGTYQSITADFINCNDKLLFVGTNGVNGFEPFITDGTLAGTKMLKDIAPNSSSSMENDAYIGPQFTKVENTVFFRAALDLYKTDGTTDGTVLVKPNMPYGWISETSLFMEYNGLLIFKGRTAANGDELWVSDGTDAGTTMLKDINPGSGNGILNSNVYWNNQFAVSNRKSYAVLNGYLFFTAFNGVSYAIWRTDGTAAGTVSVIGDLNNFSVILGNTDNKIFYTKGSSIYATDGTLEGTIYLSGGNFYNNNGKTFVFNNEFYFTQGKVLTKSDGTWEGTVTVTPNSYTNLESINSITSCGGYIYFAVGGYGYTWGNKVYRTDGTPGQIEQVSSVERDYYGCTCINNNLFYGPRGDNTDKKFWYINDDMDAMGEIDINSPDLTPYNFIVHELTNLNGNLVFTAATAYTGYETYFAEVPEFLSVGNVGSEKITDVNSVSISPNPTDGKIDMKVSDNSTIQRIKVFTISGKIMADLGASLLHSNSVDLSFLNQGFYLIRITTDTFSTTKKVIIK